MARNRVNSYHQLLQQEKERILKDPKEIEKIYDRLEDRYESPQPAKNHA